MNELIKSQSISTDDIGFLYGFSLFETMLVNNKGCAILLEKHIDRLLASMKYFGFNQQIIKNELLNTISNKIKNDNIKNKILRITISNGNAAKGIMSSIALSFRDNPYDISLSKQIGFKLSISDYKKNEVSMIVQHKTANYLENFLQAQLASTKGFDDALFLNTALNVAETTKSNVFFVSSGSVFTPNVDCGILPGITRSWIIEKLADYKVECQQGKYPLDILQRADEVFVTNSVFGIMPVYEVGNIAINQGSTGEITAMLMQTYRNAFFD